MENREQQILSEIKSMMSSIRIQLEKLDAKMAELQQVVDPEDVSAMPIDLDIDEMDVPVMAEEVIVDDDLPFVEEPVTEPVAEEPVAEPVAVEIVTESEIEPLPVEPVAEEPVAESVAVEIVTESEIEPLPVESVAEAPVAESVAEEPVTESVAEDLVAEEPIVEVEPAVVEEPAAETEPAVEDSVFAMPEPVQEPQQVVEDDDDLPLFAEPKSIYQAAIESPKAKKAVIDVMTEKESWRTDMVGTPVRDLLSAISLNDRVQFINVLFQGDPVIFQQVRAKINGMTSLDEVVEYVTSNFNWDMSSQVVYRFMMAVRRKVQA